MSGLPGLEAGYLFSTCGVYLRYQFGKYIPDKAPSCNSFGGGLASHSPVIPNSSEEMPMF